LNGAGHTEDLANVDVRAIFINLRIIEGEDGAVKVKGGVDPLAGVVFYDNVGSGAVLARVSKAKIFTRHEVGAIGVDNTSVYSGKLES